MNIESKDISVVVQGAVCPETKKCLESIREFLPDSEIILSTWKNSNVDSLDYDILVENDDPGTVICNIEKTLYNNTNRQILSTQNGLLKVSGKYTLKLRSDLVLRGNRFLQFFDKFPKKNAEYSCFKHRVLTTSLYSREQSSENSTIKTPFHPSDFWFFGLTEDIKDYFEKTIFMAKEDMTNYKFIDNDKKPFRGLLFRYSPEQYLCLSFVKRHFFDIKFEDWTDWNDENMELSNKILYNNFIFLDELQSQISCDKQKHRYSLMLLYNNCLPGIITYKKFIQRYRELVDSKYNAREFLINGYLQDGFMLMFKIKISKLISIFRSFCSNVFKFNFQDKMKIAGNNLELYLTKIDFNRQYKKLVRKYKNKKILIYAAGQLFKLIHSKYDLSELNIIGICDKSFTHEDTEKEFLGIKKINIDDLVYTEADVILIGALEYAGIIDYLSNYLFLNKKINISPIAYIPLTKVLREMFLGVKK